MKRLFILFILAIAISCKSKKKVSLAGDEPVQVSDFIEFFQPVNLPFRFADSLLLKKEKDSLLIGTPVFYQFVPDSLIAPVFGKEKKLKIYPLGKAKENSYTYLFTKVVSPAKRAAYILVFDKKNNYMAGMPAIRSDLSKSIVRSTTIDSRFTITKSQYRRNPDGSSDEGKEVYALNADARSFMLIVTDALDDLVTELVNPLDTFPRKHRLSGDYTTNKMNIVSIRDGRKSDRLSFFIHFEKNKGECKGELKGEALLRSANLAEYRQSGDPCILQFRFTSSGVTLREIEGCGAHRGLRCSFNGIFPKKKSPKTKSKK